MAGRNDILAGAAFVRLYVKNSELIKGLKGASETLKSWGSGISSLGTTISAMGAAVTGPLVAAAHHFAASGDQLTKMSQRTGASVEALSQLRYAAGQSGTSIEDLETGLKHMAKAIDGARQGSKESVETLTRLGITMDMLNVAPDKQLELFADRLAAVQDPAERAALALKVFGKSGTGLLPLFAEGSSGIRELREEADALGLTIGAEQAQAATDLGDAWDRVTASIGGAVFAIGSSLAPILESVLAVVKDVTVSLGSWIRNNGDIAQQALLAGAALSALGVSVYALGVAFTAAGTVLGVFATAMSTVIGIGGTMLAVWGALAASPWLAIAAITAMIATFNRLGEIFDLTGSAASYLGTTLGTAFANAYAIVRDGWSEIEEAFKTGDMSQVGTSLVNVFTEAFKQIKTEFENLLTDIKLLYDLTKAEARKSTYYLAANIDAWNPFSKNKTEDVKTNIDRVFMAFEQQLFDAAESMKKQRLSDLFSGKLGGIGTAAMIGAIGSAAFAGQGDMGAIAGAISGAVNQRASEALNVGAAVAGGAAAGAIPQEARKSIGDLLASGISSIMDSIDTAQTFGIAGLGEPIKPPSLGDSRTVGTFSAAAAMALGQGGMSAQEKVAKNTEKLNKQFEDAKDLWTSLNFAGQMIAKGLVHG